MGVHMYSQKAVLAILQDIGHHAGRLAGPQLTNDQKYAVQYLLDNINMKIRMAVDGERVQSWQPGRGPAGVVRRLDDDRFINEPYQHLERDYDYGSEPPSEIDQLEDHIEEQMDYDDQDRYEGN